MEAICHQRPSSAAAPAHTSHVLHPCMWQCRSVHESHKCLVLIFPGFAPKLEAGSSIFQPLELGVLSEDAAFASEPEHTSHVLHPCMWQCRSVHESHKCLVLIFP